MYVCMYVCYVYKYKCMESHVPSTLRLMVVVIIITITIIIIIIITTTTTIIIITIIIIIKFIVFTKLQQVINILCFQM